MSKKKANDEERRRSFAPDFTIESPGTFAHGQRLTTPSGLVCRPSRPISQLASRIRGIAPGAGEDEALALSPRAMTAGGVRQVRSQSATVGKGVSVPRSSHATPVVVRAKRYLHTPNLEDLAEWVSNARSVIRAEGSGGLCLKEGAPAAVEALFEQCQNELLHRWRRRVLESAESLESLPFVAAGIENIAEQDQIARTSTLLYALLQFRQKIEEGTEPIVRHGKELGCVESTRRLFNQTIGLDEDILSPQSQQKPANPEVQGNDVATADNASPAAPKDAAAEDASPSARRSSFRVQYHEGARHVLVGYRGQCHIVEVIEPMGRILVAAEIQERLKSIVSNEVEPLCSFPIHALSSLGRDNLDVTLQDIAKQCSTNRMALQLLNSAICCVTIAQDASDDIETPSLGTPSVDFRWVGKSLALSVFPGGNAVLRASGLLVDQPVLSSCASWVASAANGDPMLMPSSSPSVTVAATRRLSRTSSAATTPIPGRGRRGTPVRTSRTPTRTPNRNKGPQQPTPEPMEISQVSYTVPQNPPAAEPRHVPLWMPKAYCDAFSRPALSPPKLCTFDVSVRDEACLILATILAKQYVKPDSLPVVYAARHAAARDPAVFPCISEAVEHAARYVSEFTRFGPLRQEVDQAVAKAVAAIHQQVLDNAAVPHVSNMHALRDANLLNEDVHGRDFTPHNVAGPADLLIVQQEHQPELLWSVTGNLLPASQAPLTFNYSIARASRSSLGNTLGGLATCTLIRSNVEGSAADDAAANEAARAELESLQTAVTLFLRFVDESVARSNSNTHSVKTLRLRTPVPNGVVIR